MLYNVVLTYEAGNKILSATIQTKIAERCFPVHWAPLIMLYKVVLTFESVYEVLNGVPILILSSDPSIMKTDQQSHFLPHKE